MIETTLHLERTTHDIGVAMSIIEQFASHHVFRKTSLRKIADRLLSLADTFRTTNPIIVVSDGDVAQTVFTEHYCLALPADFAFRFSRNPVRQTQHLIESMVTVLLLTENKNVPINEVDSKVKKCIDNFGHGIDKLQHRHGILFKDLVFGSKYEAA